MCGGHHRPGRLADPQRASSASTLPPWFPILILATRRFQTLSARCKFPSYSEGTTPYNVLSVRAPTADLPNVAAFLGGMVAQEAIKMITKQYIPVNGYCVIDLVDTWTGVLPS